MNSIEFLRSIGIENDNIEITGRCKRIKEGGITCNGVLVKFKDTDNEFCGQCEIDKYQNYQNIENANAVNLWVKNSERPYGDKKKYLDEKFLNKIKSRKDPEWI